MHAPGVGQCGTQGCSLFRAEGTTLLPTKNLMVSYQMLGSLPFAVNAGFQVAFTRSAKGLFHFMAVGRVACLLVGGGRLVADGEAKSSFGWMMRCVATVH